MTHKELVERGARFLRNDLGCKFVVTEITTYAAETPDVWGYNPGKGVSILLECKTSRADFRRDREKYFRQYPDYGIGQKRYYFVNEGVIKETDDLGFWGYLEVNEKGNCQLKKQSDIFELYNLGSERTILCSIIRRLNLGSIKGNMHLHVEGET